MRRPHSVPVHPDGTVELPAGMRRRHGLDGPGARVVLVQRDDGVIELRPVTAASAELNSAMLDEPVIVESALGTSRINAALKRAMARHRNSMDAG